MARRERWFSLVALLLRLYVTEYPHGGAAAGRTGAAKGPRRRGIAAAAERAGRLRPRCNARPAARCGSRASAGCGRLSCEAWTAGSGVAGLEGCNAGSNGDCGEEARGTQT